MIGTSFWVLVVTMLIVFGIDIRQKQRTFKK
jgi:hypothetical protein